MIRASPGGLDCSSSDATSESRRPQCEKNPRVVSTRRGALLQDWLTPGWSSGTVSNTGTDPAQSTTGLVPWPTDPPNENPEDYTSFLHTTAGDVLETPANWAEGGGSPIRADRLGHSTDVRSKWLLAVAVGHHLPHVPRRTDRLCQISWPSMWLARPHWQG